MPERSGLRSGFRGVATAEVRFAVFSAWDALLLLQRKASDARAIDESLHKTDTEARCRK